MAEDAPEWRRILEAMLCLWPGERHPIDPDTGLHLVVGDDGNGNETTWRFTKADLQFLPKGEQSANSP